MKTRNRLGRVAVLVSLCAVAGCGGSPLEDSVKAQLQRDIDEDDASGRKVVDVSCREEESLCIARVRTRTGERFTSVSYEKSGDSVSIATRVDQGEVRSGPVEDGVKRDVQEMLDENGLGGEAKDVNCDRETFQCAVRVEEEGEERFVGVLVALDDSDDYSIVTYFEQ